MSAKLFDDPRGKSRNGVENMKLQDFVAETLAQVTKGVDQARELIGKRIAPHLEQGKAGDRVYGTIDGKVAFLVEFDVAVTVVEKSESGGGGGIQVMSFLSAKGERTQASESSSVSRVRFDVPVQYRPPDSE